MGLHAAIAMARVAMTMKNWILYVRRRSINNLLFVESLKKSMPFFVIKKPQRMLIFEKNNAMRTAKIVLFGLAALLTPIFHSCVEEEPKIVPDLSLIHI